MKQQTLWAQIRSLWSRNVVDDVRANAPVTAKRNYKAAKISRLNSGWVTDSSSANWVLRNDLRILRARAREMARNSSHFKKFLQMARTNIIGANGLQLQGRARLADGTLNGPVNRRVEEAFWDWAHRETCTASGRLEWAEVQRLFVTHLVRDGEALLRHVEDRKNPFGYSVCVIDPAYLDETYTEMTTTGNRVIMSVEIDAKNRPVAYYLTTPASDLLFVDRSKRERMRVPANEIEHAFLTYDDEAQCRGVTWFHAAMPDAKNLGGYNEGVITSARATAMSMGFFEREADENEFEGYEDDNGNEQPLEIDIAPVTFNELPAGYKLQQFDPKQPTQNHAAFVNTILRDVATGLGVNFFSLTGDLSAVNYSSARVGLGEERDLWRELQSFVASRLCRPVYHEWLRLAVLRGALNLTSEEYHEARNPIWRGRGWRYVDPQKEISAAVTGLQNNLTTLTDVLAEQGVDIQEHFETLKREREMAMEYGITLTYGANLTTATAPTMADEPDDEPGDGTSDNARYLNAQIFEEDLIKLDEF